MVNPLSLAAIAASAILAASLPAGGGQIASLGEPSALADIDDRQEGLGQGDSISASAESEWGEVDWESVPRDPFVLPAQNTAPATAPARRFTPTQSARPRFSNALLRSGAAQTGVFVGLASVPYMIGDTGAGTCLSFGTTGYIEGDLSHPTLTCSRLNIAENNRALVSDRVYYSYRHFENTTPGRIFTFSQNLNVDRHTIGVEKSLGDGVCSVELRVPLDQRLTSNPTSTIIDSDFDGFIDPETFQILGGRELELANISAIFKVMLAEHEGFLLSAGLGVTAPTAQDVLYTVDVEDIVLTYPNAGMPFASLSNFFTETHFTNETWYLSPFLAFANKPSGSRWFQQGFAQVEIAANPSTVRFTDFGSFSIVDDDISGGSPDFVGLWTVNGAFGGSALLQLRAQPLMRLNLGGGYFLINEQDHHSFFDQLVAMAELHYTTTLQDAKLDRIPLGLTVFSGTNTVVDVDAFDPVIGNLNSRVDILNMVLGLSAKVRDTTVTNGFTVPLRTGDNRGFDFEYNLQVQRQF
ncbi:hypothetical protein Pla123a_40450 [Posidoniimonas polymericola]|uniref:Secreted protein n=1 Tax=Posidoniimonas polymericola TaxID=2528002 RepID=A0A5C5YAL6_9BACT|nr:hypothetical protein [Posidoniimonas polymericola]TWT72746.1 hypothetical protein Pla123a_40450 [Posidoniimonas polymericola]